MERGDDRKKQPAARPRKGYGKPRLLRLGTLTEITALVGNTGMSDTHGTKTQLP
jgi:hypothetical protein